MRPRLAFSNGSEFEIWQDSWCSRCKRDEAARRDDFENGCEIVAVAMMSDEEIPEWSEDPQAAERGVWPRVRCSAFELEGDTQ